MRTRSTDRFPAMLEAARRRFEQWRQSGPLGRRIPESLWASAVELAATCGVSRVSSVLGVDYYSLKKRLKQQASPSAADETNGVATFLELTAPVRPGVSECLLELEDADGAKMRIHLKGVETPDLVVLSRSFWES